MHGVPRLPAPFNLGSSSSWENNNGDRVESRSGIAVVSIARHEWSHSSAWRLRWPMAVADVPPASGLTAVPGTFVTVAAARNGNHGLECVNCRRHVRGSAGRHGVRSPNGLALAAIERPRTNAVSRLRHGTGKLVEHSWAVELDGVLQAVVTQREIGATDGRHSAAWRRRDDRSQRRRSFVSRRFRPGRSTAR